MNQGMLISFEGPDGAGKTSVLAKILPILEKKYNREILATREPGGVAISESIRDVILDVKYTEMDKKTELLLYMAARRQHLMEKIVPALSRGAIVLVDRFVDSSVAYQGYGRGLSISDVDWLNHYATDNIYPDLTLLFDLPSEVGLERISNTPTREVNRLDKEALALHQNVRKGYLELAHKEQRIKVIDANQPMDTVVQETLSIIESYLEAVSC